eukprot:363801-Chlamydomonas_euryale.AAC.23
MQCALPAPVSANARNVPAQGAAGAWLGREACILELAGAWLGCEACIWELAGAWLGCEACIWELAGTVKPQCL